MLQETTPTSGSHALALQSGTILHGQYEIAHVLGKPGGFGITYLAMDLNLDTPVAIKEFLPRDLAGRGGDRTTVVAHSTGDEELFDYGLKQFVQEARTLARLNHPNVVRVRSFFEAHGTAYLVMDYLPGRNLAEVLDLEGGRLEPEAAVGIMLPILAGLAAAHAQQIWHRDIKPENIYLTQSGQPILLDFGAARQAVEGRSRSMTAIVSGGYAPIEQYMRKGQQGPWSDIYGCAAVMYRVVTGVMPPEATERVYDDDPIDPPEQLVPLPPALAAAIMHGLAVDRRARPQSVEEFMGLLRAGIGQAVQVPHIANVVPVGLGNSQGDPRESASGRVISGQVISGQVISGQVISGQVISATPTPLPSEGEDPAVSARVDADAPRRKVRVSLPPSHTGKIAAGVAVVLLAVPLAVWKGMERMGPAVIGGEVTDISVVQEPVTTPGPIVEPVAQAFTAEGGPTAGGPVAQTPASAQARIAEQQRQRARDQELREREQDRAREQERKKRQEQQQQVREPSASQLASVLGMLNDAQGHLDRGAYGDAAGSLRGARTSLSSLRGTYGTSSQLTRLGGRVDALFSRTRRACEAEALSAVERQETPPNCRF